MFTQPPPQGLLMFQANAVEVDAQGRFTANNLQPGDYRIDVISRAAIEAMGRSGSSASISREHAEVGSLDISVAGDISDLVIQTSRGFEVRGRIAVDDGSLPSSWLPNLRLNGGQFSGQGEIASDSTFVLRGMEGQRRIQLTGLPAGAMVDRVIVHGRDVTDSGWDVNGDVVGAEVAITTSPAAVAGRVVDGKGDPADADVIVYAENADLWIKSGARYVKTGHSGGQQGFRVTSLPPGRYLVVAVQHLDEFEWANPVNLEQLRPIATAITLVKGETRTLTLIRK